MITLCGYCSDDLGTGVEKFSVSKFLKSYCLIKSSKVDFWCVGGGSIMGKNSICGETNFLTLLCLGASARNT